MANLDSLSVMETYNSKIFAVSLEGKLLLLMRIEVRKTVSNFKMKLLETIK